MADTAINQQDIRTISIVFRQQKLSYDNQGWRTKNIYFRVMPFFFNIGCFVRHPLGAVIIWYYKKKYQ